MKNLPQIMEYPILIKILKKEYVDDLLDGNLYMNNLKYFVDLEKETGIAGVGDIREASLVNIRKHRLFIQVEGEEKQEIELGPPPGVIYDDEALYHPVFCCMGKLLKLQKAANTNEYMGTFKLAEENLVDFIGNNMDAYRAIMILDVPAFLDRIYKTASQNNICGKHGFINYRNRNVPNIQNGQWILDDTFTKDTRFKNQLEFRIELFLRSEKPYIMNIGNIRDLAISVDCEKLISSGFSLIQTVYPEM